MRQPLSPRLGAPTLLLAAALAVAAMAMLVLLAGADGWTLWVVEAQRALHRRLADALAAVRREGPAAAWPLIALSFAYGVFHAAGPGHGKVVLATYLTTQPSRLRTALALTVAAALAQAVTAIVAVHAAVTLLELPLRQARGRVGELEILSFALVAGLGAFLALGAVRRMLRPVRPEPACATCGGHHPPALAARGLAAHLAVIASIGLRPCSGAVVVLLLAYAGDLRVTGIAAALAMAVGTALTTSALAGLAVTARGAAEGLALRMQASERRLARLGDLAALGGGLVLLVVGVMLAHAVWTVPAHPLR